MTAFPLKLRWIGVILLAGSLPGCGKKAPGSSGGRSVGKVEAAFLKAAESSGIPVRFLQAAGYVESRLVPTNATSTYISSADTDAAVSRGTVMTQTAFGLTYEKLGLDASKEASGTLEVQVEAYARYLASTFKDQGLTLANEPRTAEEKFYWLEDLAMLHRVGNENRRVVQVAFAREMVSVLNEGFLWQDPTPGRSETMRLEPESPPIKVDAADFPQSGKNWFKLTASKGLGLNDVPYYRLASLPTGTVTNSPRRVEVVHCPLSLSSCLELQTRSQDGDADLGSYVYLSAHYVVPSDADIYGAQPMDVIQVAPLDQAVTLTNTSGENVKIQDAVVIMLTGNSGRNVGGTRIPALPTWFSSTQLATMADLANRVCQLLATPSSENPSPVNFDECIKPEGNLGIRFRHQGVGEEYRWGDIADFDDSIFNAYVRSSGSLNDEVAFELAKGNREFRAGAEIPLTVLFNSNARKVRIERLNRCASGKLVWENVSSDQTHGTNRLEFSKPYYDNGPNHNGEQFFRALVYGKDTKLMGWSIVQVFVTGFDKDPVPASEDDCEN